MADLENRRKDKKQLIATPWTPANPYVNMYVFWSWPANDFYWYMSINSAWYSSITAQYPNWNYCVRMLVDSNLDLADLTLEITNTWTPIFKVIIDEQSNWSYFDKKFVSLPYSWVPWKKHIWVAWIYFFDPANPPSEQTVYSWSLIIKYKNSDGSVYASKTIAYSLTVAWYWWWSVWCPDPRATNYNPSADENDDNNWNLCEY